MFTLGYKEAIVNGTSNYAATAYDAAGAVLVADGDIDLLVIDNFGTFKKSQLVSGAITAAAAGTFGSVRLEVPSATEIGLATTDTNVSVTMLLRVKTSRDESGWANDFIERGRPFVISLVLDGSDSSKAVADKVDAALTAYEQAFIITDFKSGSLPFDWVNNKEGGILLSLKKGYLSFTPAVTFVKKWDTYGLTLSSASINDASYTDLTGTVATTIGDATVTGTLTVFTTELTVSDLVKIDGNVYQVVTITSDTALELDEVAKSTVSGVTASKTAFVAGWVANPSFGGTEPIDGKYLEENVSMATDSNTDIYGPNSGDVPMLGSLYSTAKWSMTATDSTGIGGSFAPNSNLGVGAVNAGLGARTFDFIMYFNASVFTDNSATAIGTQIQKLAKFFS